MWRRPSSCFDLGFLRPVDGAGAVVLGAGTSCADDEAVPTGGGGEDGDSWDGGVGGWTSVDN